MAPKVPGLFANPTTGMGGIGSQNLNQARLNLQNYKAPELDRSRIEGLAKMAGGFQAKQQQKAQGVNLSGLAEEFGIDVTQPYFDPTTDSDTGFGSFFNDTIEAAGAGLGDMGFGASLILNDNETNMLALEQNYQRMQSAPAEELGYDPNSYSRFVDADWFANVIGGTLPSIGTMVGGGVAGFAAGTAVPVIGNVAGLVGGASAGAGGGAGLQQLGNTAKAAYMAYREQGKSVEEAYELAYDDAKVDGAKTGALASVATLVAPLRFARGTGVGSSKIGVGVTAAPATTKSGALGQFAQQSLIVQPTFEVVDTVASNQIAANSYDPTRTLNQGALDAFVGSIFFDLPTTAGGYYLNKYRGKYRPAFDTGVPLLPAPRLLLEGPAEVGPETAPTGMVPAPPLLPAPQFVIKENADGGFDVIDNLNADFRQSFDTQEDAQFEATRRNDEIMDDLVPAGFNPDSATSRVNFLDDQIARFEQFDASKRAADPEGYSGDLRIRNTIMFFQWLKSGNEMLEAFNQKYTTAAQRNTQAAMRQLEDIQERIALTKILMNPVRTTKLPNMIFQTKQGKTFRVVMDKSNRPLRPTDKAGNPKMNHVMIFDPSSKTGVRTVAISSGTLEDVSSPTKTNILTTAPIYNRLMTARNKMMAEMRQQQQQQIDADAPPLALADQSQQGQIEFQPRSGPLDQDVQERGTAVEPGTTRDAPAGALPDPNDPQGQLPLGPPQERTQTQTQDQTQTEAQPQGEQQLEMDLRPPSLDQEAQVDAAEAEAEVEYTTKTFKPRMPDGSIDQTQPPITSVSDGTNTVYTQRLQGVGTSEFAWYLVTEAGDVIQDGSPYPNAPIGDRKADAVEFLKGLLRERSDDPKFARSRDSSQRAGTIAFGEGVEAMVDTVPEADRPNLRKILLMFQQALGKDLDTLDVVDMAAWLQKQDQIADDGNFVAAYLNGWVKQQGNEIKRGAIALQQGMSAPDAVRVISHELTHFTIKVKNISKETMVAFYESIPDTDPIKTTVDSDPYYSQQSVEVRAEEVVAETLAQMLTRRYRGRLHQESTFKYILRQIVRTAREAFEAVTGRNSIDTFFANMEKAYGVDIQATNPFMDRRDPVFGRVVPINRKNVGAQTKFGVDEVLPGGNYVDLDQGAADVTGKVYDNVTIAINPATGAPSMVTSDAEVEFSPPEQTQNREGRAINLVNPNKDTKKRQKWEWLDRDNDTDPIHTIVSITSTNNLSSENGGPTKIKTPSGPHEYALMVDMDGPAKLSTFPDAPDEPRLRPVMYAQKVERGPVIGRIRMFGRGGGKEHPVYEYIRLVDENYDAPKFARKTSDDGDTLPPEAASTMEEMQEHIPEHRRVERPVPFGTQHTNVQGQRFIDQDLTQDGPGWIGQKSILALWEKAIENTPGGKEKLEILRKQGINMLPKMEEFWNLSFKREDRARYWYEISSEMFRSVFPDATDAELEQFIDLVGATSVQANPTDNMLRAVAVFSEYLQGIPIETDLTDAEGVRKALSPEMLGGPKTRSFSGTMLYLLGKRAEVPLSTNDRQVATVFGVTGEDIAGDYVLYELISNFYIGLRDEMNANLPPSAEPYETWQIQALGWVEERAQKNAAKNKFEAYDDYAMVIQNSVLPRLAAAGIQVPNGRLTRNVLKDPRIPFALRDTMGAFTGSPISTIETVTKLNPVGERFATIIRAARGMKGTVGAIKEADALVKRSMNRLAKRGRKGSSVLPNAFDKVATAVTGKATRLTRVDTTSYGTFEAEGNPNIRVPLGDMDSNERQAFLAIVGRGLRQAAMAASVFKTADVNLPPRPDHQRTFSVFIQTTDKGVITAADAEAFDKAIGRPINVKKVANGYVFDINVGGFDPVVNPQVVSDAVVEAGLDKKGQIALLARDYKSEYGYDYIEMDQATDDDAQIGYENIINDYVKELVNGAVQTAQGYDSRIVEANVRAYLLGNDDIGIFDTGVKVPSAVAKRVERLRTGLRGRISDLREAEVEITEASGALEAEQEAWLDKHGDKLEKLIAGRDKDEAPKFARQSLIPEADKEPQGPDFTDDEAAVFARVVQMPSGDTKNRALEWMSRNWFTGLFSSSAQQIIGVGRGTKAAYRLANLLDRDKYARTGRDQTGIIERDVHDQIAEDISTFSRQFVEQVLKGLTTRQVTALADIMRGRYINRQTGNIQIPRSLGISVEKARAMRGLMNDLYAHMEAAYRERGLQPPPKLPFYFPQRYDIDRKIKGVDGREAAIAFFTRVFSDRPNPRKKAEMIVAKIEDEGYQPTWGFDFMRIAALEQKSYNITPQELRRIINIPAYATYKVDLNGKKVEMKLADLLNNDTVAVTQGYIASTVRRSTFIKRFGAEGEDIQAIAGAGGAIDRELSARNERTLTSKERKKIFHAVRANMGILPRQSFFGASDSAGAYNFQNGLKLLGNMTFLSLSAIASLPEFTLIFARTGMIGGLAGLSQLTKSTLMMPVSLSRGAGAAALPRSKGRRYAAFKEAYGYGDTDMKIFARDMGIIFESFQYALQNAAEEGAHFKYERWNNAFFRAIGLQPLTEATQAAALAGSVRVLPHWRKKAQQGNAKYIRWLKEVGLTKDDLLTFDPKDAMATANPKVRAALRQMVSEIVMNPDPGRKPTWMSDPRFALLAHIKSWIFTFNNTVLQRTANELTHGNVMPLIYLAGFGALSAMLYEFKEWLRYGEEGNPYMNRLGFEKGTASRFIYTAMERGGLFGPAQFFVDAVIGTRTGAGFDPVAALVPTYNLVQRGVGGVVKIVSAPIADDPERMYRSGVNDLTRTIPGLNAMGEYRSDFVTAITGVEPGNRKKGSGISRGGASRAVSR